MNVAVVAKLDNKKLMDKINPLLESKIIEKIFIVRSFYGLKHPLIDYMKISQLNIMKNKIFRTFYVNVRGFFYLLKKKPQLIITYYFVPHGIVGIIYGKILRKKVITCIIGSDINVILKNLIGPPLGKFLCISDKIITTGSNRQLELKKVIGRYSKFKDNKMNIIPNTTNLLKRKPKNLLKRPNQFIYVGRLDRNKRPDIIIRAFSIFLNKIEEKRKFTLFIVGTGPLINQMRELTRNLDLTNNIKIIGFQNDVPLYYSKSRFIVLSSKHEGLPAVLLEAMNHGCIPITTNVGNINNLVNPSNGFLLSNCQDRKILIKKFSQKFLEVSYLNDKKLLKMSRTCIETINKHYLYKNGGEKWRKVITSLIID